MILNIPDEYEIVCYVCGKDSEEINAIKIINKGKIKGLIFACKGKCSQSLNNSLINLFNQSKS